ncbi:MAG: hypothetical protein HYZ49_06805 [Chloroflexi bacterium]|nr:hypothetical protein [Chloroflexota bacterium]
MKTVRNVVRKIIALSAKLQSYRTDLLTLGLVFALLVAACGNGSTPTLAVSQGDAAGQPGKPGTEEFGMTKEELVRNIEATEALVAKCMSDAGFEYIAVDYDTVRKGMTADKALPGVTDEQFVAQYGYGISTLYTGKSPQLADIPTAAQIGLGEQNAQIFKSLSPADQVAYNITLFGQNSDATFAVSLEAEDFSRAGGCTRAAVEQVFTSEQLSTTYLNPKDALIAQDPRMIAAVREFSDCVREAGFSYNHPNEIEADIKNRLAGITKNLPLEALSPDALTALTELQGEERAVATVATECEANIIEPVAVQIERELYGGPQP